MVVQKEIKTMKDFIKSPWGIVAITIGVIAALVFVFWNKLQFWVRKLFGLESQREKVLGTGSNSPRSIRNNNPGNIKFERANRWKGKIPEALNTEKKVEYGPKKGQPVFEQFEDIKWGARAHLHLLKNAYMKRRGLNTIRGIITIWSPPFDTEFNINQDTDSYIRFVSEAMGVPEDAKLSNSKSILTNLAYHMARHEAGPENPIARKKINLKLFQDAWNLL